MQTQLVFLKLGGSLITDKAAPHTARIVVIQRLVREIASALRENPALRLLLGHGSGSFGHVPAGQYRTREGVRTPLEWQGFVEVWREARALNDVLMDALAQARVSAIAFPPSAWLTTADHQPEAALTSGIQAALAANLVAVVNGDVVFDSQKGGTIYSTEEVFRVLAPQFKPQRILIAGSEPGIWADYPLNTRLITEIRQNEAQSILQSVGGSSYTDVTGGMRKKAEILLDTLQHTPASEGLIFSGLEPDLVLRVLRGEFAGTRFLAE